MICFGCSDKTEKVEPIAIKKPVIEQVNYNYKNGNPFLTGSVKSGLKVGIWKEYYPTGQIKVNQEFDEYGEMKNYTSFYLDGGLKRRDEVNQNNSLSTEYDKSGIISYSSTRINEGDEYEDNYIDYEKFYENGKLCAESRTDEENETYSETEYFENGKLKFKYKLDKDDLYTSYKELDSLGKVLIDIKLN